VSASLKDSILIEFQDSIVKLTDKATEAAISLVDQLSIEEVLERFQTFFPPPNFGEVRIKNRWRTSIEFDARILAAIFNSHFIEKLRSTNEINPAFTQVMKRVLQKYVGLVVRNQRKPIGNENPFGMVNTYELNFEPRDLMRRFLIANYSCALIGGLSETVRLFQSKLDLESPSLKPGVTVENYESCLKMIAVPALVGSAEKVILASAQTLREVQPNLVAIEETLEFEILRQIQPAIVEFQKLKDSSDVLGEIYESRPGSIVALDSMSLKSVLLPGEAAKKGHTPLGEKFLMKIGHELFAKQLGLRFNSKFQIDLSEPNGKLIHDFYQMLDKWIKRERLATTCLNELGLEHILPPHIEESALLQASNRQYSADSKVRSVEQQVRCAISGDAKAMLFGYDWQRLDREDWQIQLLLQKHYSPYLVSVSHILANKYSFSFVKRQMSWLLFSSLCHFDVSHFDFERPAEPQDEWLNQKKYLKMLLQNIANDSGEAEDFEDSNPSKDALEVYLDEEREHEERVEKILSSLPDDDTKKDFIEVAKDAQGNRWSAFMSAYLELSSPAKDDATKHRVKEIFGETNAQD
jgi:hypothetical protein